MLRRGTAALAAGLLLALPVSAAWENKHGVRFLEPSDFPRSHQPLVAALNYSGIATVDGGNFKACEIKGDTYLAGYYLPEENGLIICTNTPDKGDIPNTLTHEAVHAVQDCRAGLQNGELRPAISQEIRSTFPQDLAEHIAKEYPEERWAAEAEAFYFADHPDVVLKGVERFCIN